MPPTNGRSRRVLSVEELERMKVKDLDDLLWEHGFQKGKQKKTEKVQLLHAAMKEDTVLGAGMKSFFLTGKTAKRTAGTTSAPKKKPVHSC